MKKRYWVLAAAAALAEVLLLGLGAWITLPEEERQTVYEEISVQLESGDGQVWRNGYW